jgi:triacylglycerol lipase
MRPETRSRIEALGLDLTPEMMGGTQALFAETFRGMDGATRIQRDLAYGSDPRHRLDLFTQEGTGGAPVLVYVHGGGFVMGDKRSPAGLPFYDNVGDFAARSGMLGVTITYRLAPDNPYPAGPEDLGLLVAWLRENAAEYGGDPERIFLMGQSAGAVHVASYVAHERFHAAEQGGIAGALLVSAIYDVVTAHANPFHKAYYGEDESGYAECSTVRGLIGTRIPWLATVSEFDGVDFQRQAAALVDAYAEARQRYPRMLWLAGHNHLSPALEVGSPGSALEPVIGDFIATHRP